jgi:hypothetical protein
MNRRSSLGRQGALPSCTATAARRSRRYAALLPTDQVLRAASGSRSHTFPTPIVGLPDVLRQREVDITLLLGSEQRSHLAFRGDPHFAVIRSPGLITAEA